MYITQVTKYNRYNDNNDANRSVQINSHQKR